MKNLLTTSSLVLTLAAGPLFGQERPMSQGEIPPSFLDEKRLEIIESTKGQNSWNSSTMDRESGKFAKKAQFFTNEFMLSGNVLFGDTLSNYLNNILDNLLGPTQRDIKAYAYRSTTVNAFMTIDGSLFVSTGLLAQVQNEAELAFVMAHEVVHYEEDHIIEGFKEEFLVNKDTKINDLEKKEKETAYSKEQELEADRLALKDLMKSSPYDMDEAIEIFDVLLYSYLPFDERPLNWAELMPPHIHLPASLIAEEKPITAFDDYDDSESSHPNIKKRKEQYLEIVTEISTGGEKKSFVQSKEAFLAVQKIARKEVIHKSIENDDFPRAIYNSIIYKQDHPEEAAEMDANIAFCWHAISGYADDEMLDDDVLGNYDDVLEGNLYSIYHLVDHMSAKDLAIQATWANYKEYLKDTTNEMLEAQFHTGLFEMTHYHEIAWDDFKTEAYIPIKDTLTEEQVEALSKVDKIRYKKAVSGDQGDYMMYAFIGLMEDEKFVNLFEEHQADYQDSEDQEGFVSLKVERESGHSNDDEDHFLGAGKVLVLSPSVYAINALNRDDPLDIDATYQTRFKIHDCFIDVLKASGMDYELVTPSEFTEDNVEQYNDYCKLKWWVNERLNHVNAPVEMHNARVGRELAEIYETPYLYVSGVFSVKFPSIVGSSYRNVYYSYVFDLETGDAYIVDEFSFDTSLSKDYIKTVLYDTVYQISTQPKS